MRELVNVSINKLSVLIKEERGNVISMDICPKYFLWHRMLLNYMNSPFQCKTSKFQVASTGN